MLPKSRRGLKNVLQIVSKNGLVCTFSSLHENPIELILFI